MKDYEKKFKRYERIFFIYLLCKRTNDEFFRHTPENRFNQFENLNLGGDFPNKYNCIENNRLIEKFG